MGQIRYTATHEWLELDEDDGIVGITDRLSLEFGEIIHVELPELGGEYEQEDPMGNVEFVTGETIVFHAPVSGEVIEVNEMLADDPDLLNRSPEGDGWICRMQIESPREFLLLMERDAYEEFDPDAHNDYEGYGEDDETLYEDI